MPTPQSTVLSQAVRTSGRFRMIRATTFSVHSKFLKRTENLSARQICSRAVPSSRIGLWSTPRRRRRRWPSRSMSWAAWTWSICPGSAAGTHHRQMKRASRGEAQTRHRELPVIPRLTLTAVYPLKTKTSTALPPSFPASSSASQARNVTPLPTNIFPATCGKSSARQKLRRNPNRPLMLM